MNRNSFIIMKWSFGGQVSRDVRPFRVTDLASTRDQDFFPLWLQLYGMGSLKRWERSPLCRSSGGASRPSCLLALLRWVELQGRIRQIQWREDKSWFHNIQHFCWKLAMQKHTSSLAAFKCGYPVKPCVLLVFKKGWGKSIPDFNIRNSTCISSQILLEQPKQIPAPGEHSPWVIS